MSVHGLPATSPDFQGLTPPLGRNMLEERPKRFSAGHHRGSVMFNHDEMPN